ncbi:MAG TPA: GNAT family N-acetyltransferase [Steroidobacteraceae bacterium]|nr:GNAT family N-acetyltransferase [Steroidobacteraceae bacterium]
MDITLRRGVPGDAQRGCAEICYRAFRTISQAHNFPPDVPSVGVALQFLEGLFTHPGFYCVVAEQGQRIVGSNVLDERDTIYGIGPITVDPEVQNRSVGRRLMEDVLARATARGASGVRLVQAAFHNRSLSLYTSLGFEVREPLACVQGAALGLSLPGRRTRAAVESDVEACNQVCRQVHGHDRGGELRDAISRGLATVVEYGERITGYATPVGFSGHAVGECNADLQALIGAAKEFAGPGFLLPTRNGELFRWCLAHQLRVVQPMTLMSIGLYNEPAGAFLPSILY